MKLYAKTTSERASKGQGGNRYLDIDIIAEGLEEIPTRQNMFRLVLTTEDGKLNAKLLDYSNGTVQDLITHRGTSPKGKK